MSRPGFLTKARLRRLLMSDDVWSFGTKRHPAEFAQTDEDAVVSTLETDGHPDPRCPQQHQAPKQQLRDEGRRADETQQTPGHQHGTDIISQPANQETKQSLLSHSAIGQHVMKSPTPQDETDQSRVTVLQSPDQIPVCEFSTGAVLSKRSSRQPAAHLQLDTVKKGSLSHASDCKTRCGHPISENTQETSTITFNDLSGENTDLSDTESDTTSLNVRNNQRLQTVLMLNNNHEDGLNISISEHQGETRHLPPPPPLPPFCPPTVSSAEDISVGHHSATTPIVCPNTETQTPPPETFMQRTVLVHTDSVDSGSVGSDLQKQACDSSPSGADNMSSLSLSTESLGSSEEEGHRHKEGPHPMGYPNRCGFLGHGYESYHGQRGTGDWEERLVLPDDDDGGRVLDSLLSEILSPVDEVLSYGSAELPPSARGAAGSGSASLSLGLPPAPPAFEIITWTSEEDLPPPPTQELDQDQGTGEDPSIASEHIPPLPPDSPMPPPLPPPCVPPPRTPPGSSFPAEGVDSFHCHCVEIGDDEGDAGDDEDDGGEQLSGSVPLQDLSSENEDSDQSENTTSLPVDEGNDMSDTLSSFHIGDRVLVCRSRPGVLRFKGPTAFASGTWAGVELDGPNGNHDGTFRGVKYFTCERNRGVLVRAADLSHLPREPGSDLDTGLDEDPFSDEEPPHGSKLLHSEEQTGNLFSGGTTEQDRGRTQNSSSTDSSAPRRTCGDVKHKHSLQASEAFPQSRCSTFRKRISLTEGDLHVNSAESCLNNNGRESSPSRLASWPMDGALKEAYASKSVRRNLFREAHRPRTADFKKMEDIFRPCLVDQWHSDHHPEAPNRVPVHPHDCEIVYRLGDTAIDTLFGSGRNDTKESCETPSYLINDESRNRYRQVFFRLTSDILHEVFPEIIATGGCLQSADSATEVLSELQSSKLSVRDIKVVIKREIRKMLNLEKSEKQTQEMLQTLCKFWHTKRDKVDFILIQELQREEVQWTDYSLEQEAVKTRLAEDIFRLLLDDTIAVLRDIYSSLHHTNSHSNC